MGARELLDDLAGAGFSIAAEGDRLVIRPWSKLTDDMREALRCQKPELLALLANQDAHARPFKLTLVQTGAAHADPWDEAAMARFEARVAHLRTVGICEQDAEDLAETLHLRDVHADHRHLCLECRHYRPGSCANYRQAGLQASDVGRDMAAVMQQCRGFNNQEGMQ